MKKLLLCALAAIPCMAEAGTSSYSSAKSSYLPDSNVADDLGLTWSNGYTTGYIFRGTRWTRDLVFTNLSYTADVIGAPVTFSALYGWETSNGTNGVQDKLMFSASAPVGSAAGFDFSARYDHYFFDDLGAGDYGDISVTGTRDLGFADFSFSVYHQVVTSLNINNGWYYTAALSESYALNDRLSLKLETGVGYNDNYFSANFLSPGFSGFANYYASAFLTYQVNDRFSITPFVTYNGAIKGSGGAEVSDFLRSNGDALEGGVVFTASF